jgi:hypothetical protein
MPGESSSGKPRNSSACSLARASLDGNETQPQTFVEMILALLEERFPWLGKGCQKKEGLPKPNAC